MITTINDWKKHKASLIKESNELNRTDADIKEYADVQVGDMAFENPAAGGVWDNELGPVLWKGSYQELLTSQYASLKSNWELDEDEEEEIMSQYDLIVINDHGQTLFNYNNDPSGCVVFKDANEALDKVGEEDNDINNDGQVDNQDDYLKNRRKAISANIDEASITANPDILKQIKKGDTIVHSDGEEIGKGTYFTLDNTIIRLDSDGNLRLKEYNPLDNEEVKFTIYKQDLEDFKKFINQL